MNVKVLGGATALLGPFAAVSLPLVGPSPLDLSRVWVQAEVRHCRASRDGSGHQVGVQFVAVDPQDERLLSAYLESRR